MGKLIRLPVELLIRKLLAFKDDRNIIRCFLYLLLEQIHYGFICWILNLRFIPGL